MKWDSLPEPVFDYDTAIIDRAFGGIFDGDDESHKSKKMRQR